MIMPITPEEFNALLSLGESARQLRGIDGRADVDLLGVPAERYRKYEARTPMPHALMEQFA